MSPCDRPLLRHLDLELPWHPLGEYPTPCEPLPPQLLGNARTSVDIYTKRDDLSSPIYGGNKVRSLELLLPAARAQGAQVVHVTGASGSNHVLATALHAPRLGLRTRALVFQQPHSPSAEENARLIRVKSERVRHVPHWSLVPYVSLSEHLRGQQDAVFLSPGGASPLGVLGHVSAGLELAEQVHRGHLPPPSIVVVGLGSGATAAGLLLGFWLAARLGIGPLAPPVLWAVRVAPWPLASRGQVLWLASAAARLLNRLSAGSAPIAPIHRLSARLVVDGCELGRGYGHATPAGSRAEHLWREAGLQRLDSTYSAKVAAAFLRLCSRRRGERILFWSTKSSVPLPTH